MGSITPCRVPPLVLLLVLAALSAPARGEEPVRPVAAQAAEAEEVDWDEDGSIVWDPFERANRGIFQFNETLDAWLMEPVATGWDFVVPDRVQLCVANFFTHLTLPVRFANDVLQLKPLQAFDDTGRFVVNTLVGVGGLFDPATRAGIPRHDEDFGQTLGRWGVPAGPYLVLPLLGPSNPRDTVGLAVDSMGAIQTFFLSLPILASAAVVNAVNDRSLTLETVRAERESALDFYAAVRTGYSQFREGRVRDRAIKPKPAPADEDLYYLDDEEEYEDE
ncbi:MAG TPA: VacJ family lipoprotein [Myxococcota bacterium]